MMLDLARANLECEAMGMGMCPRFTGKGTTPSNGVPLNSMAGQKLELCGPVSCLVGPGAWAIGVILEAVSAA